MQDPDGALAGGLAAQPVGDAVRLRRGVTLAVLALDPCVGFEVEVERLPVGQGVS